MAKISSRGRTEEGEPNPVDVYVGSRIQVRRQMLGLTQEKLASLLGLTFQQVQKYEKGGNRIGASRMWDIAKVLGVNVEFFYADMPEDISHQSPRNLINSNTQNLQDEDTRTPIDPMLKTETLKLVEAYYKIKPKKLRDEFLNLFMLIVENNSTQAKQE